MTPEWVNIHTMTKAQAPCGVFGGRRALYQTFLNDGRGQVTQGKPVVLYCSLGGALDPISGSTIPGA